MTAFPISQHSKTSGWTKVWIVLKNCVLYELRAAEDTVAILDTPILGYSLETEYILEVCIIVTFIDQRFLVAIGILQIGSTGFIKLTYLHLLTVRTPQ